MTTGGEDTAVIVETVFMDSDFFFKGSFFVLSSRDEQDIKLANNTAAKQNKIEIFMTPFLVENCYNNRKYPKS